MGPQLPHLAAHASPAILRETVLSIVQAGRGAGTSKRWALGKLGGPGSLWMGEGLGPAILKEIVFFSEIQNCVSEPHPAFWRGPSHPWAPITAFNVHIMLVFQRLLSEGSIQIMVP